MTQIRINRAAQLLGVSDDTLRRWVDAGRLSSSLDEAGRMVVDGVELARLSQERAGVRAADDESSTRVSARNHFEGLITRVVSDAVMSSVELQCGPYRVLALISTEAVTELGLEPGVLATARIKATNVVVERPENC